MESNVPLPYGWIQQIDSKTGHVFYIDTKANPPRSIWTHPYEDEQYLREHPDVRNKVRGSNSFGSDASLPFPLPENPRRHSFNGRSATPVAIPPPPHKQGLFSKLKAKAINSVEQHNKRKRQRLLMAQQQQQRLHAQQPQSANTQFAPPRYAYPQSVYPGMGSSRHHGGMGGMALPLAGGMAGGLLLGDMLDNDFDGGREDWGGGSGGDWGGGDF
jgi:hypothetical protein